MIRTISEFMTEVAAYFPSGFANEKQADAFARKLSAIKPRDLQRLYDKLLDMQPASFSPDVKALSAAIEACGIIPVKGDDDGFRCPSCGYRYTSSGGCPKCAYDAADGDPEEYAEWYRAVLSGRAPRYDVSSIMKRIAANHTVRPPEGTRGKA